MYLGVIGGADVVVPQHTVGGGLRVGCPAHSSRAADASKTLMDFAFYQACRVVFTVDTYPEATRGPAVIASWKHTSRGACTPSTQGGREAKLGRAFGQDDVAEPPA